MSKIKAPLFSLYATGTLDKNITYKSKLRDQIAQKYAKPGDKNPFESSPRQKDQRSIIRLITIHWQCMSSADKLSWENAAKDVRFKGTGYHYFLHMAQQNLTQYLGLVGYWSMNYNIDEKIPDLSGNGNHGTLSPIYPCDCPTLVDSFDKKHGLSIKFNGSTNYLNCGNNPSLYPTSEATFETWIYPVSVPTNHMFFSNGFHIGTVSGIRIGYIGGQMRAYWYQASSLYFIVPDSNPPINEWTHFTFLLGNGKAKLYINGKLQADIKNFLYITRATTIATLFGCLSAGVQHFNGILDDCYLWERTLSEEEITKHSSLI